MSDADVRVPGFWNSVNRASSNRTIITQRAKFRRFAFIPSPYGPSGAPGGVCSSCSRQRPRLSVGTSRFGRPFCQGNWPNMRHVYRRLVNEALGILPPREGPERRAGAGSTVISAASVTRAPARVRRNRAPGRFCAIAAASASWRASSLPSSTGPSLPTCASARPSRRSATSEGKLPNRAPDQKAIAVVPHEIGPRPHRLRARSTHRRAPFFAPMFPAAGRRVLPRTAAASGRATADG